MAVQQNDRHKRRGVRRRAEEQFSTALSSVHEQKHRWGSKRLAISAIGVAVATGLLYASVLRDPFISFDDREYVTDNPFVKAGITWRTFTWAWTSFDHANWHPLTWLSHALDVQLFGMNPVGHHLTSLLLHAVNAALVFAFFAKSTTSFWRSLTVSVIFAAHPLNVESVAWIAERKSVLCMLFSLLTMVLYLSYSRRPKIAGMAGLTLTYFFAIAAKPMAVTLPCVLVLLDRWPLQRVRSWHQLVATKSLWLEKLPLFAISIASCVTTILAQLQSGSVSPLEIFPLHLRLENAAISYVWYAWKMIAPVRLAFLYPWPSRGAALWECLVAVILITAGAMFAWSERERRPYLLAGALWFAGTLVPMIGILQVGSQARADRYAYFPMIGLVTAAVWWCAEITWPQVKQHKVQSAFAIAAALTLAGITLNQLKYWRSDYALWLHTWQVTSNNYLAADKVGVALQAEKRFTDAAPYFEQALRINPSDPLANFNVGTSLQLQGRLREAIARYQVTSGQGTTPLLRAEAYENMGTAYIQLGDASAARVSYLNALRYDPQRISVVAALNALDGRNEKLD